MHIWAAMFKTMKLGTKLAAGFGLVLLTTSLVTAFTLVQVRTQTQEATDLVEEVAPQVRIANEIERAATDSMNHLQIYEITREAGHYEAGTAAMAQLDLSLRAADALVLKHQLATFGASVARLDDLVKTYRGLAAKAKDNTLELMAARTELEQTTQKLAALAERDAALKLLGTHLREAAWKAEATDDAKALEQGLEALAAVQLEPLGVVSAADSRRGDELRTLCAAAAAQMRRVQEAMRDSDDLALPRTLAAAQVTAAARALALSALDETILDASRVASELGRVATVVSLGLLLAIALGSLMSFLVTRSITGPVNRIIDGLSAAGEQVASASGQVSSSSQQLANGASQQASNLEEVSSSLEEVTSMTRQNAESAGRASSSAQGGAEAATRCAARMANLNEAMQKIRGSASETAKIVKTIDEIAFQTNLLALNAAVEAARAGDSGKGFAVVAEEVRSLAQRSADAARTTAALIEESQRNAEAGATVGAEVNSALAEIVSGARQITGLVADVATASAQQTSGVAQINTAVGQMDRITQSNAANAEESASASEELSAQAVDLNSMVAELAQLVNGASAAAEGPRARLEPRLSARAAPATKAQRQTRPLRREDVGVNMVPPTPAAARQLETF
ncbi:MAG: methyl-accepting chemotaxis protein [Archangium sp.]|nr:methyl-accepting chemotaxis protein [Archangium sp.]